MQLPETVNVDKRLTLCIASLACHMGDSLRLWYIIEIVNPKCCSSAVVLYCQGCVLLPAFVAIFLLFSSGWGSAFSFSACNKKDSSLVFLNSKQPKSWAWNGGYMAMYTVPPWYQETRTTSCFLSEYRSRGSYEGGDESNTWAQDTTTSTPIQVCRSVQTS